MRLPLLWQVLAKETTGSCHTTCMFERRFSAFRRCQDRCEVFYKTPIYKETYSANLKLVCKGIIAFGVTKPVPLLILAKSDFVQVLFWA